MVKQVTFQERISKAKALFHSHLPEKISDLEKAWHHLRYIQWSSKPLTTMNRIAHTLAGSAGTLGYQTLAEHLRELDHALMQMTDKGGAPDSEICQHIDQLIGKLERLAEGHLNSGESSAQRANEVRARDADHSLVYLVDDDPVVLQVLDAHLNQAGYVTRAFASLKDLYEQLTHETPSLIILDIVFPQGPLAGVEALQSLQMKTGFQIPVIFVSARGDIVARLKALRAGGTAFFTKPVDIDALLATCRKLTLKGEEKYRVLLVDDDQVCLLMHQNFLEEANFTVACVNDPLQVLKEIHRFNPDVLVLDLKMPNCDGTEVAHILRQEEEFKFLPILFLSGTEDPQEQKEMSELANCEFLGKPVEHDALITWALRRAREYHYLQNKLIELEGVESNAFVISRYEFIGRLEEKLIHIPVTTESVPAYLIYLVLDELDEVRKKTGLRSQGQVNLQLFGRLEEGLKANEFVAGQSDGILLILKHGHAVELTQYTDTLLHRLETFQLDCSGEKLSAKASIGVLPLHSGIAGANDAVLRAEKSASRARQRGGNQYVIEEIEIPQQQVSNAAQTHPPDDGLQEALQAKRFSLNFQPIVNVGDPSFDAFEVFVRLRALNGREFLPEQFLPILEERKELKDLDRWVYSAAIETLHQDQNALQDSVLYLKVARATIANKLIVSLVSNFMREARVKGAGRMVFLLKQNDILENLDQALLFANRMRGIGCKIGVENFSLDAAKSYFQRMYPDVIKLSVPMIRSARASEKVRNALRQLVKDMDERHVDVVVTEIESVVDMQSCYKWGVKLFQGYAIQAPGETLQREFDIGHDD